MNPLKRSLARHKSRAWDYVLRQYGEMIGEQIALAIEATTAGPGAECADPACEDFQRHAQGREDAATARRVAVLIGEGRYSPVRPSPPCPAVVAALAEMEAAARR